MGNRGRAEAGFIRKDRSLKANNHSAKHTARSALHCEGTCKDGGDGGGQNGRVHDENDDRANDVNKHHKGHKLDRNLSDRLDATNDNERN